MLDALVRARGLQQFAYFLVTGEGSFLPNGVEVTSGHVLDATGRVLPVLDDLGQGPGSG